MIEKSNSRSECFLSYVQDSKALVEQAAAETGFAIFTSHDSVSNKAPIQPGFVAVWTCEQARDHKPFWERLRELREERVE